MLSRRISARFEIEGPGRHRFESGGGIYTYYDSAIGRVVTGPSDRRSANRKVTYSGLVGFHALRGQRVGFAFLAGAGVSHESHETVNYRAGTNIPIAEFSAARTELVPIVTYGLDAEIPLTSHVAVGLRLRGHLRLGTTSGEGASFDQARLYAGGSDEPGSLTWHAADGARYVMSAAADASR